MHSYVQALQAHLQPQANPAEAKPMSRYMRDQFPFLGLKTPARRVLLNTFLATHGLPPLSDLDMVLKELWALPEREYQYSALTLLDKLTKTGQAGRSRLAIGQHHEADEVEEEDPTKGFFDQDR